MKLNGNWTAGRVDNLMVTSSATLATNCSIKPGGKVNSWDGCGDDGAGSVDCLDVLGSFLLVFFFGGVVAALP